MGGPASTGGTSTFQTISALVKPFIGAGILSMVAVWSKSGLILSNVTLLILAYVAGWCIFKLAECADTMMLCEARRNMQKRIICRRNQITDPDDVQIDYFETIKDTSDDLIIEEDWIGITLPSFPEIGRAAFGYWGGVIVDICIIITQMGAAIAYTVFISQNMSNTTNIKQMYWVMIIFIPLVLLTYIRRMEKLAPTAVLGNLVYVFTIVTILYQGYNSYCCVPKDDIHLFDISYFAVLFGTCSFSLEGIALVLPIRKNMAHKERFPFAMLTAMVIITFLYIGFPSASYIAFGNDVESPVILSLPDGILTDLVRVSLSISLYFTFALQVFPVSSFFDDHLDTYLGVDLPSLRIKANAEAAAQAADAEKVGDKVDISPSSSPSSEGGFAEELLPTPPPVTSSVSDYDLIPEVYYKRYWLQNLFRTFFVAFVCGIAIVFPDFQLIVALFGSLSNAALAYVLPALFWVKICSSDYIYGFKYFPYDRYGTPTVHPYTSSEEQIIGTNNLQDKTKSADEGPKKVSKCRIIFYCFFPLVVAIAGVAASGIGVVDAIKEIIKFFNEEDDEE